MALVISLVASSSNVIWHRMNSDAVKVTPKAIPMQPVA